MTQALAVKTTENNIYESLALRGDLSGLKPEDKTVYMQKLCESLGLNPFTQPFIPLKLNGKEILYASRGCTDQLASIHKLTREIIKTERIEDVFVATCKVSAADGRFDISTGAVTLGNLKGDALANALMKAECVPVNYEILTLEGWKSVFDLSEHYTEKVFAYDAENFRDDGGIWVEFEKLADIHISVLADEKSNGLSGTYQAIAYPLDGNGNTITDSSYIQLF